MQAQSLGRAPTLGTALLCLAVLGSPATAPAVPVLYGVVAGFGSGGGEDPTGPGSGGGSGGSSFLVRVDTTDGSLTEIADVGFGGSLSALASDASGQLWSAVGGRR